MVQTRSGDGNYSCIYYRPDVKLMETYLELREINFELREISWELCEMNFELREIKLSCEVLDSQSHRKKHFLALIEVGSERINKIYIFLICCISYRKSL